MPTVQGKTRPLVDPNVYALAREWITECYAINADTADAASDCLEDAVWDFAAEIQQAMETWLGDAEGSGRLRLLRGVEEPASVDAGAQGSPYCESSTRGKGM